MGLKSWWKTLVLAGGLFVAGEVQAQKAPINYETDANNKIIVDEKKPVNSANSVDSGDELKQEKSAWHIKWNDYKTLDALLVPVSGLVTTVSGPGHRAIDITNKYGSKIRAIEKGIVRTSSYGSRPGKFVVVDHPIYNEQGNQLNSYYAHLSESQVSVGDTVSKGQVIGLMGNSGRTRSLSEKNKKESEKNKKGVCLHLVTRWGDNPVNPATLIPELNVKKYRFVEQPEIKEKISPVSAIASLNVKNIEQKKSLPEILGERFVHGLIYELGKEDFNVRFVGGNLDGQKLLAVDSLPKIYNATRDEFKNESSSFAERWVVAEKIKEKYSPAPEGKLRFNDYASRVVEGLNSATEEFRKTLIAVGNSFKGIKQETIQEKEISRPVLLASLEPMKKRNISLIFEEANSAEVIALRESAQLPIAEEKINEVYSSFVYVPQEGAELFKQGAKNRFKYEGVLPVKGKEYLKGGNSSYNTYADAKKSPEYKGMVLVFEKRTDGELAIVKTMYSEQEDVKTVIEETPIVETQSREKVLLSQISSHKITQVPIVPSEEHKVFAVNKSMEEILDVAYGRTEESWKYADRVPLLLEKMKSLDISKISSVDVVELTKITERYESSKYFQKKLNKEGNSVFASQYEEIKSAVQEIQYGVQVAASKINNPEYAQRLKKEYASDVKVVREESWFKYVVIAPDTNALVKKMLTEKEKVAIVALSQDDKIITELTEWFTRSANN